MPYDLAAIRELVTAAFSSEDLSSLCFDHYRDMYEQFTAGQSKPDRVLRLVERADRLRLLDQLLAHVKAVNAHQYARLNRRGAPPVNQLIGYGMPLPLRCKRPAQELIHLPDKPASRAGALDREARAVSPSRSRSIDGEDPCPLALPLSSLAGWLSPDDGLKSHPTGTQPRKDARRVARGRLSQSTALSPSERPKLVPASPGLGAGPASVGAGDCTRACSW